jgi:hypothetical protein
MIELATIPKSTKSAQIRNYVAANPKAKSADVAKAIGVTPAYVATVMWTAKKKAKVAKKLGGMQKKKAMTDKSNWKQLGLFKSNAPIDDIKVGSIVGGLTLTNVGNDKVRWTKSDAVNHPAHYKVGGIETIDFIEAKKLGYNLGNVVKYLTRADHKGNRKQDLEKAKWYLERELSTMS